MGGEAALARPVPVVRTIIENSRGRVLFLRRAQTAYGDGGWCLPGGKVDYGETVEQAAKKELREETALECTAAQFLFHQDSLPSEPGSMHCINFYFECEVAGNLEMNPESSAWAWIGPEELEQYEIVFGNDDAVRRFWDTKLREE
jgi:mutator protein MutT